MIDLEERPKVQLFEIAQFGALGVMRSATSDYTAKYDPDKDREAGVVFLFNYGRGRLKEQRAASIPRSQLKLLIPYLSKLLAELQVDE